MVPMLARRITAATTMAGTTAGAFFACRAKFGMTFRITAHRRLNRKPAAEGNEDDGDGDEEPANHSPPPRPAS